jgi:2-keto-3-deoxy-L-rhamnonate aldolase RhmA
MTRFGTVLSIGDPVMAELAAQAFDLLWIDMEHGALSARDAQVLAMAVQSTGAQAFVRVPSSRAGVLPAILDAGVDGIVVPSVDSAEEARLVVSRMSYPPAGVRGFGPRRAGAFGRTQDFPASTAASPACVVQIESPAGVARVEEIAAVPGVECLVLGCADLAVSLGIDRRLDTPELAQAAETVADAAARAGISFGLAGTGPARQIAALAAGRADVVLVSADVRLYAAGVDAQADALRNAFEAVRAPA